MLTLQHCCSSMEPHRIDKIGRDAHLRTAALPRANLKHYEFFTSKAPTFGRGTSRGTFPYMMPYKAVVGSWSFGSSRSDRMRSMRPIMMGKHRSILLPFIIM
uniref:Uncharacterized protein n=1 Tax=Cacopsylla melanoneura TaxID=428564 RepID=A0A8D8Q301_9HEMI